MVNLTQAADIILNDGVVCYPTEAVYGLGCLPNSEKAVHEILRLKQRPIEKGVILIAGEFSQLTPWIDANTLQVFPHIKDSWAQHDCANTWLVPFLKNTPNWITGQYDSIAVRVSHNPTVKALCERVGSAIVSTSANPAGDEPARTPQEAKDYFPNTPVVEGALSGFTSPSTIRDAHTQALIRL